MSLAADTFTRADNASSLGTAETGGAWTAVVGTWGISSNQAVSNSGESSQLATLAVGTGDVDISADITLSPVSSGAGVAARVTDANNYICAFLRVSASTATIRVRYTVAGVTTTLAAENIVVSPGTTNSLRLRLDGLNYSVLLNDAEVMNSTIPQSVSDALTGTAAGLFVSNVSTADDGQSRWDNLVIEEQDAGAGGGTLVQGWATGSAPSGSLEATASYPITTTMGNLLLVVVTHNQPLASVLGNGGGVYTLQHSASSATTVSVYTKVATNNETSVTATLASTGTCNIAIAEYSGLDVSSTVETSYTNPSTTLVDTTTGAVTAGSISFACVSTDSTLGTWSNGFVEQVDFGARGLRLAIATRDNTLAGTYPYTADKGTTAEDVAALTITFGAFAGAATVTPPVVSARGGVGTPTVNVPVHATPTPARVAVVARVGSSTPVTQGQTVVPAQTVAAVAGVMTVVGVDIDSAITPDVVAARVAQPLPAGTGGGEILTSVPGTTAAAMAAVPTPTISTGNSVTVVPDTVAVTVALDLPDEIVVGTPATVSVETVAVVASAGAPLLSSNSVVVPQTVVAATTIFAEPVVAQGVSIYIFRTPTVDEAPLADNNPMFLRMTLLRGVTVLRTGDTFTEVRNPTQDELDAADYVYIGGYEHRVTGDEAAALEAAGYTLEDVE